MTKILDRLPIFDRPMEVRFGDRHVRVKRDQILIWVSVHLANVTQLEANVSRLPALLDTANNCDFAIQNRHLREWAGIDPAQLAFVADGVINGQVVNRHEATVWLYPNVPGKRDVASDRPPFGLMMRGGIAVYPRDAVPPGPRLPLLGLPALLHNDLDFWLDPELRQVTVQTRTWRRRLMRLLCRL